MLSMLSATSMLQAGSSGLTLQEVLADIPHDAASIAVYVMIVGSLILLWRTGRAKRPGA